MIWLLSPIPKTSIVLMETSVSFLRNTGRRLIQDPHIDWSSLSDTITLALPLAWVRKPLVATLELMNSTDWT